MKLDDFGIKKSKQMSWLLLIFCPALVAVQQSYQLKSELGISPE